MMEESNRCCRCGAAGAASYVGGGEGEHREEDDGQFGFRHFGAHGRQDSHNGSRLRTTKTRLNTMKYS